MNSLCVNASPEPADHAGSLETEPALPLTLVSVQARALEEMLAGASLSQVLASVAQALEAAAGPGVQGVVRLGEDRSPLVCAASPSGASSHRSVPIKGCGGRLLGTLDIYWPATSPNSPDGRFEPSPDATPAYAEAVRLLARTAALAIEHDLLCRRVTTLEAGQVESQCQFSSRAGELTELTRHLQRVQEEERSRLAQELHDRLGAFFTATKFDMARLKSALGPLTPEVTARLAHFTDMLDKGIALKRRIIEDLRPSALSSLGLVQALEILISEFRRTHGVTVQAALEPVQQSASVQLTMYRLVQEALVNVATYACATEVSVWLKRLDEGGVEIGVRDDGVGFDVQQGRISMLGLLGMHYRVQAQGGRFSVQSSPGCGATVSAVFPCELVA